MKNSIFFAISVVLFLTQAACDDGSDDGGQREQEELNSKIEKSLESSVPYSEARSLRAKFTPIQEEKLKKKAEYNLSIFGEPSAADLIGIAEDYPELLEKLSEVKREILLLRALKANDDIDETIKKVMKKGMTAEEKVELVESFLDPNVASDKWFPGFIPMLKSADLSKDKADKILVNAILKCYSYTERLMEGIEFLVSKGADVNQMMPRGPKGVFEEQYNMLDYVIKKHIREEWLEPISFLLAHGAKTKDPMGVIRRLLNNIRVPGVKDETKQLARNIAAQIKLTADQNKEIYKEANSWDNGRDLLRILGIEEK